MLNVCCFFLFKQKTAYEMRISDWRSDVCSSDLDAPLPEPLEDLSIKGIPDGPLREFLEFHGFKSLLARLNSGGSASAATQEAAARRAVPAQPQVRPEPKIDRSAYETVTDETALDRWIAEAYEKGLVAFATERDGRDG